MSAVPTLTITFIRHGESTDNLRSVWAGWKDAPLSNHGMNQAKALGQALSNIRFTALHASPLKRALWTAQAVQDAQPEPKPPLTTSLLLREQHWGVAEGKPWTYDLRPGLSPEQHWAHDLWPVGKTRQYKFPEGESLDDLAVRAEQAINEIVMPYVLNAAKEGTKGLHIAIASHGLCISELVPALLKKDVSASKPAREFRGLHNTAWTRMTVDVQDVEGSGDFSASNPPPLTVRVTHFNSHDHLQDVARQKGGIGSAAFDPKQKDIRAFFGGGAVSGEAEMEEGRSESNAKDEADIDIE